MRHEWLLGYALLLPALLWSLIALALPLFVLTAYSFWTQQQFEIDRSVSLANYENFFERPVFLGLLARSIRISLWATIATVLIAYPVAYLIAFKVQSKKWLWIMLFTIPFWTSYLLRIFSWKVILGYNGFVNATLTSLNIVTEPLEFLLYNELSVVIALTHAWLPFAILPIYLSLAKIDQSLLEAAADLGEQPAVVFLRVTLPLSAPGVLAASLLIFIPTVGDYVTPELVGGPGGSMIGSMVASLFLKTNNAPMGAATAIVSILAISLIVALGYLLYRLLKRYLA